MWHVSEAWLELIVRQRGMSLRRLCGLLLLVALCHGQTSLEEPNPAEYYPTPANDGAPPRVKGLTQEAFMKLAAAGKPFVVTDYFSNAQGGKMPMDGWTCDSIRSTFADGKMKQEYTRQNSDNQKIGDAGWMSKQAPWPSPLALVCSSVVHPTVATPHPGAQRR